jgi:hypothetical protein
MEARQLDLIDAQNAEVTQRIIHAQSQAAIQSTGANNVNNVVTNAGEEEDDEQDHEFIVYLRMESRSQGYYHPTQTRSLIGFWIHGLLTLWLSTRKSNLIPSKLSAVLLLL